MGIGPGFPGAGGKCGRSEQQSSGHAPMRLRAPSQHAPRYVLTVTHRERSSRHCCRGEGPRLSGQLRRDEASPTPEQGRGSSVPMRRAAFAFLGEQRGQYGTKRHHRSWREAGTWCISGSVKRPPTPPAVCVARYAFLAVDPGLTVSCPAWRASLTCCFVSCRNSSARRRALPPWSSTLPVFSSTARMSSAAFVRTPRVFSP